MTAYRIGVWAAVSSRAQAGEDKSSLEDQEAAGRRFAEVVGGEVVTVYRVPGHSRDIILWQDACDQMPGYAELYRDWQNHRIDILHAISADRLGRDSALVAQFYSLAGKFHCEIYIANAPHAIGQQTLASRIVPAILGIQAEQENQAKVYRQYHGMRKRVLKKGLIPGTPPFGYKTLYEGGLSVGYEPDEYSGVVLKITRMFLEGMPYAHIVREVNRQGIPAPEGGHWMYGSVQRLLLNDAYAGLPSWSGQRVPEPTGSYPPIWDEEMYEAIIRERQRRHRSGYVRKGASSFTGVAFCRRCGKRMNRMVQTSGHAYMRCSTHVRMAQGYGNGCHSNLIAEHRVADALTRFFKTEVTEESLREKCRERKAATSDLAALRTSCQASLDALHSKRERLALAYAAGAMPIEIYRTTEESLRSQEVAAAEELRKAQSSLDAEPDVEERIAAALYVRDHLERSLVEEAPALVAKLLQDAGIRVWVEAGNVVEVELIT